MGVSFSICEVVSGHFGVEWTLFLHYRDYQYLLRNLKFSRELGFKEQNSENVNGFLYDVKSINCNNIRLVQWKVRWFFIDPDQN